MSFVERISHFRSAAGKCLNWCFPTNMVFLNSSLAPGTWKLRLRGTSFRLCPEVSFSCFTTGIFKPDLWAHAWNNCHRVFPAKRLIESQQTKRLLEPSKACPGNLSGKQVLEKSVHVKSLRRPVRFLIPAGIDKLFVG